MVINIQFMYCENCGNKLDESDKFCTKCGHSITLTQAKASAQQVAFLLNEKWWWRLFKVIYIILYIPLPVALFMAWQMNNSTYDYYTSSRQDTTVSAFWYSLLTLIVYMVTVRLIKISFLYITVGKTPEWKKEVRKIF